MSTSERSGMLGLISGVLLCLALGGWWFDRRNMAAQYENDVANDNLERARIKHDLILAQDKLGRAEAKIQSLETALEAVAADKKAAEAAKKAAEEKETAKAQAEADAEEKAANEKKSADTK